MLDQGLEEARRSGDATERYRTELAREWRGGLGSLPRADDLPALTPLQDGQAITLGGDACETIWTSGHADGQYCLYNPSRKLLFGADHLLPKMSPPAGPPPVPSPRVGLPGLAGEGGRA